MLLIQTDSLFAQNYDFRQITTSDGLPSSTITGITKDKNGIIWIGTEKGLCYISNGKIKLFKGLPDEGIMSIFASSDGSLWVSFGVKHFLVKIKNGKLTSFAKEKAAIKNGIVLSFFEHKKHIYLAQNDGITVISPEEKFKPLSNKILSDTMMSYWTVDFFTYNNKVYATSVLRGVNEILIQKKDVLLKNVYKGEFLYGSTCLNNNLILSFDPIAKLFDADKFLNKKNQTPLKNVSARRPATFVKDKSNTIFGGCYNLNFGNHGLIKLNSNFKEELILPEIVPGQELYYDEANNDIYFGTGFGVYIVNASLYAKQYNINGELTKKPFFSSYPEQNGVVALNEDGLFYFEESTSVRKQISQNQLLTFANNSQKNTRNLVKTTQNKTAFKSIYFDDLILENNKWIILSNIGFFIVNKQFIIEDFIPIHSSCLKITNKGELIVDQYRLGLIHLKNKPTKEILYDCFRDEKIVLKHVIGIELFGQKPIIITENQGAFRFINKTLKPVKLKNLESDIYKSTLFQNRYLVISTVNGDILFYDSEENFKLVKTIEKSSYYNESIIDISGNMNYLVFITAKRTYFWDGKSLKSYNDYQNGTVNFNRVNLNGNKLCIYSQNSIYRIEIAKLLQELDKKIIFHVTNHITKTKEAVYNTSSQFFAKNKNITLQFSHYNELNTDVLKSYYRINENEWIELEQSGKIYLQNLEFGNTKVSFKVLDKRIGKVVWQQTYIVTNPTPWYLSLVAILLYFTLFSMVLIFVTRYFILKSKQKEIERLTLKTRLKELQMEALQSQMNPHFVFNALNSVQKFILNIDPEKALLFLNQFSVLIRKVLDYSSLKSITIEEELEFIDLYVGIENERFQGLIAFDQEVDCDELISIPPLLIQPLIENAIIYGFRNEEGKIHINFSIKQLENELRIEIKNEINPDMLKNHGYQSKSTEIIQKRLRLYDGNLALSTTIKNSIFTATLFLPTSD